MAMVIAYFFMQWASRGPDDFRRSKQFGEKQDAGNTIERIQNAIGKSYTLIDIPIRVRIAVKDIVDIVIAPALHILCV